MLQMMRAVTAVTRIPAASPMTMLTAEMLLMEASVPERGGHNISLHFTSLHFKLTPHACLCVSHCCRIFSGCLDRHSGAGGGWNGNGAI